MNPKSTKNKKLELKSLLKLTKATFLLLAFSIPLSLFGQDGLVAYYPFSGNTNDESDNNIHGTVHDAKLITDRFGNENSAYHFDGNWDYIEAGTKSSFNFIHDGSDFTISIWEKHNTSDTNEGGGLLGNTIGGDRRGFILNVSEKDVYLAVGRTNPYPVVGKKWENVLPDGDNWNHIAITYNKSTNQYNLFINGNNVNDPATPTNAHLTGDAYYTLKIGTQKTSPSYSWANADIDDLSFYDKTLSETEIKNIFSKNGWTGGNETAKLKIQINPLYNNPNIKINRDPDFQNQFNALIELENQGEIALKNIEIEAYLGDEKLQLVLKDVSNEKDLDIDKDGIIDELGIYTEGNPDQFIRFPIHSNSVNESFKDKKLIVKILSINSVAETAKIEKNVSIDLIKGADNQPFELDVDAYRFPNPEKMSFEEITRTLIGFGISPVNSLLLLCSAINQNSGRCFGMSSSVGAYFLYPEYKPLVGNPFNYYPPSSDVLGIINRYHISQISRGYKFQELDSDYSELKKQISMHLPVVLAINAPNNDFDHAILATKITEIDDLAIIQVYENELPNEIYEATYDKIDGTFAYSLKGGIRFDKFNVIGQNTFSTPDLAADFSIFYSRMKENLSNTSEKVFAWFNDKKDSNKSAYITATNNSYGIVTNPEGQSVGYLADGTFINTIPEARVVRVPNGENIGDSITLIYVPSENHYECRLQSNINGTIRFEYYNPISSDTLHTASIDSIEVNENTVLIFEDAEPSAIQVDENNDGNFENSLPTVQNPSLYVGISRLQDLDIKIFPNPAKEKVFIQFKNKATNKAQVNIYNISGQKVFSTQQVTNELFEWDRTNNSGKILNNGIYIIELIVAEQKIVEKILIE